MMTVLCMITIPIVFISFYWLIDKIITKRKNKEDNE